MPMLISCSYSENVAAVDVSPLGILRKALFCGFGGEISFWLKIWEGRNTPCIAGFPNSTARAKDPTKSQKESFSAVANCIDGRYTGEKLNNYII